MSSSGKAQEHLRHNDVYFEIDGLPDDDWFYWETGDCYIKWFEIFLREKYHH